MDEPELIELHDARLSELIRSPEEVELSFARMSGFFATGAADVFDVRSCSGTLNCRDVSSSSVRLLPGMPQEVANGTLTVDGDVVELRGSARWRGHCVLALETMGGLIELRAREVVWSLDEPGDVFEQWKGPLRSRAR